MQEESARAKPPVQRGDDPEVDPQVAPAASALLEREWELAELEAVVAETCAATDGGRLVAIEAPAGLGKTRLLQAARETAADAGLQILTARATELERDFPFALVRQLFEPPLGALPAPERDALLDAVAPPAVRAALGLAADATAVGAGDAFTVLHGLHRLTVALAERRPLLLAIDDAHWADAASLDWIAFLLPRLEQLPALVAIAARPDEPGAAPGVARILGDEAARRLEPRALGGDAARVLLASELGAAPDAAFAATCHEVSGGNPFLLRELARTLAQQSIAPTAAQAETVRGMTPERVARNVVLRLGRLSPDARAVARALVVLGEQSDSRLVGALASLDADAVPRACDELRAVAILDADPLPRFAHPLVRNAVESDLPAGERAAEHARAAALLRECGASAEQLAKHVVASDPCGDAVAVLTLIEAGMRAIATGAPRSAIAYLTRALREPPPGELRVAVLTPLVFASIAAGDEDGYAAIEADFFQELDRVPALRREAAITLSAWLAANGRFEQATVLLESAIADARHDHLPAVEFRLQSMLSVGMGEPPAAARARLQPYFDQFEPGSTSARLASALRAAWCLFEGSASEAARHARHALDEGRAFRELPELAAPGWTVLALNAADQLDDAARMAEQVVTLAETLGVSPALVTGSVLQGTVAHRLGQLATAETVTRRASEIAPLSGLDAFMPVIQIVLIDVLIDRGDLRTAEIELAARSQQPPAIGFWFAGPLLHRGRVHLARGRPQQAADDFLELQAEQRRWEIPDNPLLPVAAYAARAFAALGDLDRARTFADEEMAMAERWGSPSVLSRALRAQALVVGGRAGIGLLRQAVDGLDGSPARLERAHALAELGTALRRDRQRVKAREPLAEALELARRCGAAGLARHAYDELQACGERRRRHTPIGVDSLTPSERRVADLAASGMTNRQIAQTLYLTVKTVETHLSACYDKLGIRSRTDLHAALATDNA